MRQSVRRLGGAWLIAPIALLMVAVFVGIWASVNNPGPTAFLELDDPANLGFDGIPNAVIDWANSGATSDPNDRDCTATAITGGTLIECNGVGGLFDGGIFHNATTAPTPPEQVFFHPNILAAAFEVDPLSVDVTECGTGDPTVFTANGGEVNGDDLNTETFSTGSIPNKDEISNAYAISHQDPPNAFDGDPDNINEIFAGFERVVNNGDSHVDLEFLQEAVGLVPGSKPAQFPCAGKFQGHRSQGDLLLSVDFSNGGEVGTPSLHKWVCGDFPPTVRKICDPVAHPPGKLISPHYELVSDADTLAAVRQTINGDDAVSCGGWACRNANGTQNNTIAEDELYEVGIDLAKLGFEGCLSTFLPHTRSSTSFTSVLKDFAVIPFNTCVPSTILTKEASATEIVTGGSVTYTYFEENDGNIALLNPSVEDDKCSPVTFLNDDGDPGDPSDDGNNDNVLDVGETWVFTCTLNNITQDTTNIAIGHGTFMGPDGPEDVTWCEDPNEPPDGVRCDQEERDSATVTVLIPGTNLVKRAVATVRTTVNYTYLETNDGEVALTSPTVEDDKCAPVIFSNDDGNPNQPGNNDNILDVGETWVFTCTTTFDGQGPLTNVAIGHGSFSVGGQTKDVTFCAGGGPIAGKFCDQDERDTKTVTSCTPTVTGGK